MFCNVSTLKGKIPELQLLIEEKRPHIICLQETRMSSELRINGYTEAVSKSRTNECKAGRGSKILVKSNLTFSLVKTMQCEFSELVGVAIILPKQKPVNIIGVYLSPQINSQSREKRIEVLENTLSYLQSDNPTFLVGDFNARLDIPQHLRTNPLGEELSELENIGLISVHASPAFTRYDPAGRDPSILDFTICNPKFSEMVRDTMVLEDIGSDHRPVITDIGVGKLAMTTKVTPKPNLDQADWLKYHEIAEALMVNAPAISGNKSCLDNATDFITETIRTADIEAIPRIIIKTGVGQRALPRPIVQLIQQKKRLRNRIRKNRWEIYLKPEINRLDREIKEAIRSFEDEKKKKLWESTTQKNQYGFYKLARQFMNSKNAQKTHYPIQRPDGSFATSDEDRVQIFAELYRGIYSCPQNHRGNEILDQDAEKYAQYLKNEYSQIKPRDGHDISTEVTAQQILKALGNAKRTSPGKDGIYYIHVSQLPDSALEYLAKLYSTAITCCYFPALWKKGKTILLPKPGKKHQVPRNYRPITLLSALGKTLEKLINARLVNLLEEKGILPESQSGFRKRRSTQDQLFRFTQDITEALQKNMVALATMFDVEKAYDKVWHEGLFLKLKQIQCHGVTDKSENAAKPEQFHDSTIALIHSFLVDREIVIAINQTESEPIRLKAGTPQGAILSPAIFNIWVSDIPQPEGIRTRLSQFADDIATWTTAKSMEVAQTKLQHYNNRLVSWSKKWRIQLSAAKTNVTKFHHKRLRKNLNPGQTVNGIRIPAKDEVLFLGMMLDKGMTFKKQEQKIVTELNRRVKLFAGITGSAAKPLAPTSICIKILQSMIIPTTTYGCAAMCIRGEKGYKKQDILLRKAARLAIHAPRSTRNDYLTRETGLEESKLLTIRLAKQYLLSDKRCISIKEKVRTASSVQQNNQERTTTTPLNVILG